MGTEWADGERDAGAVFGDGPMTSLQRAALRGNTSAKDGRGRAAFLALLSSVRRSARDDGSDDCGREIRRPAILDLETLRGVLGVAAGGTRGGVGRRRRVVVSVFGSVDFYCPDTEALCRAIGTRLAGAAFGGVEVVLATGANAIVQRVLSEAFCSALARRRRPGGDDGGGDGELGVVISEDGGGGGKVPERAFHLTPVDCHCPWTHGTVLEAGWDMGHRRRLLGSCASVGLSLEGGPGTADEMEIARVAGAPLVPVGRTGGASSGMFGAPVHRDERPAKFSSKEDWDLLWDEAADVDATAEAVV